MSYSNCETKFVSDYLLSDASTFNTINTIVVDLLSKYSVDDASLLLSYAIHSIANSEMINCDNAFVIHLAKLTLDRVMFNEIADELIADLIAVG